MSTLYLLLPILILLILPVAMLALRVVRPRFLSFWLLGTGGVLLAFPLIIASRTQLPIAVQLTTWQPESWLPGGPTLVLDELNWPFALALAALVLAFFLTEVVRAERADWPSWASSLVITAIGLIGVLSGNLLTVVLSWAAIDAAELVILFSQTLGNAARERILAGFLARIAGIFLVIYAALESTGLSVPLTEIDSFQSGSWVLILAIGLRLGILPLQLPLMSSQPAHRSLGTMLRLAPGAAHLALLTRTAAGGAPPDLAPYLLALAALAALFAAISWLLADSELEGRPYWLLGVGALAFAGAVRGYPEASMAWGAAALFSGGLIFLFSTRHRNLLPVVLLGLFNFSGLPFSPSWEGMLLDTPSLPVFTAAFILAHAFLMAGYLRHALGPGAALERAERWVYLIYPLGLLLLPATHFFGFLWLRPLLTTPAIEQSWPAFVSLGISAAALAIYQRGFRLPADVTASLQSAVSLGWLYRLVWKLYQGSGRLLSFITGILEGEGGILWALLLLTLLITWLAGGP